MAKDLTQAAIDVINNFNKRNKQGYEALEQKMEYNVVLKRVLYPDSVNGIGDVIGYLEKHMLAQKPHLAKWQDTLTPTTHDSNEKDAISGQVSGTGIYFDDDDNTNTPIFFTLGFVRKNKDDEWSLINSFATPTGRKASGDGSRPQWSLRNVNAQEQEDVYSYTQTEVARRRQQK